MLLSYSKILLRRESVGNQTVRCLFGFGKKKTTSVEVPKEEKNNVEVYESPTKEKLAQQDLGLPIKVTPPDAEKRSQWLFGRAPIFYIPKRRSGYAPEYEMEWSWRALKQGAQYMREELPLFWKEMTDLEIIKEAPILPGETDKTFTFTSPESIEKWVTTADSDHNEGFSTVEFNYTKDGRAIFAGELSTRLPKDGRMQHAGYCNVRSPQKYRSFMQRDYYNWIVYNIVELRIRGDGRTYAFNIHAPGEWDTVWDDMFSHPIYTRGGPYWQTVRIPFSKFIFSNKGRIQDVQYPVPIDQIHCISISIADNTDGPFKLEIDYIGVVYDPSFTETRAFEDYKVPNFMVQN